jgi:hypothetical protein
MINFINVIYVIKGFIGMNTYNHTLEHIQLKNLINVVCVAKSLVQILP